MNLTEEQKIMNVDKQEESKDDKNKKEKEIIFPRIKGRYRKLCRKIAKDNLTCQQINKSKYNLQQMGHLIFEEFKKVNGVLDKNEN